MKTALQLSEDNLDDNQREFLKVIREDGWFNTRVSDPDDDGPVFSYSTGFTAKLGFPEIIVFSLGSDFARPVLRDLWRDIEAGKKPQVGTRIKGVFGKSDAVLLPVAKSSYAQHLEWNRWFYGNDNFECLQLVWPDPEGKFPWEEGFDDEFADCQPDLTGNNWKSHPA